MYLPANMIGTQTVQSVGLERDSQLDANPVSIRNESESMNGGPLDMTTILASPSVNALSRMHCRRSFPAHHSPSLGDILEHVPPDVAGI